MSITQFGCFSAIVERESGWNVTAANPTSGAYGLMQALPGSKMASAGSDWRTNGATQIRWGISYIAAQYGSPCGAWAFWQSHGWY
jgi:soluble lytic murein transglycosylase-like protein